MFYFVFVSLLLSNAIWSYSKAAASMTSISQKANSSKWLRWSSFLEDLGCVAILPLRNVFFFFCKQYMPTKPFWDFAWILGTKIIKYYSSFRTNVWLHLSSTTSVLLHINIDRVLYKYTVDILFLGYSWQFYIKIQNFVGGNNPFEKRFRQKFEKCFINIKILPRFAKLSVAMTLYQKSTKLYLICYILSS